MYDTSCSLLMDLMFSTGPRIVRPSGEYWKAVACRWSNTSSDVCLFTCLRKGCERFRSSPSHRNQLNPA
jgi:hypothetical protein